MTPRLALFSILLVCLVLHEVTSIRMPSLFGTRVTKNDAKKETDKDDAPIEYQDQTKPESDKDEEPKPDKEPHKPTRPPLLFGIPHPANHPLHPHNRPDHPLHPDNLPHLPSLPSLPSLELPHLPALPPLPPLPSLPHFTRETIHATKTVFVEVTDKVTVHPVCMTVYKVTSPCLPYNPHHGGWRAGEGPEGAEGAEVAQAREWAEGSAIKATAAPLLITPTATADAGEFFNLEPTRILGGEYISDGPPVPSESADYPVDPIEPTEEGERTADVEGQGEGERSGRWVEITPPIKVADAVVIEEAEQLRDDEPGPAENTGPLNMVQNLIHRSPVTHYKTKTLWVTKVEKVLDTRVTATLIAKNCIPTNSHIPYCAHNGGLLGPGFHENHHHLGVGTILEAFGGVIASGGFTDKVDGQKPENEVHQEAVEIVETPVVAEAEGVKQQSINNQEEGAEETTEPEKLEETNVADAGSEQTEK